MNLVFFTHPMFLGHQSMPRFANMLAEGMKKRGHVVEIWSPSPRFYKLPLSATGKKWLSYVDQYVVFPQIARARIAETSKDTLFVFTDHALGPWVPLVADRPHVIHCHDFLAQQSALGEIPENPTGWTGRQYQRMIRKGYSKGKNFISVSQNTRELLHRFLTSRPQRSEVVYNGFNQVFEPLSRGAARNFVSEKTNLDLSEGYLLHVGGNQWYKNREGVIQMYNAWRTSQNLEFPLLLIGETPNDTLKSLHAISPYKSDIHFLVALKDEIVRNAYAGASLFLFPSKAEGFGWPIAEAMASACPVITTNEAPMTEVAGNAGFLIPRQPHEKVLAEGWATKAASKITEVLTLSPEERKRVNDAGLENSKRFDTQSAVDMIEEIYKNILQKG